MSWLSDAWNTLSEKGNDLYDSLTSKNFKTVGSLLDKGGKAAQNWLMSPQGLAAGEFLGPEIWAGAEGLAAGAQVAGATAQNAGKFLENFETPKQSSIQKSKPSAPTVKPPTSAPVMPAFDLWNQTATSIKPSAGTGKIQNNQQRKTVTAGGVTRRQQLKKQRRVGHHRAK